MSASAPIPTLPIIDVSPWGDADIWRSHVAAQIDWAASEFGFFYIVGHGIDPDFADRLIGLSRIFFDQQLSAKQDIAMSRGGRAWRGYFPVGGELTSGRPDQKEGLYFGEELTLEDVRVRRGQPLHGPNLFPRLAGFREAVLDYMRELTGLSQALMASIGRGLHLGEKYFSDGVTGKPTTLFRIFNYPCDPQAHPDTRGVGEHTDYGLLTVLYQDDVGGLQVRYRNEWLDVPPVPGSFVVNIGDMLERITSGRYPSALHRVLNRAGRARLSMPFFFDPSFDAVLQPAAGVGPSSRTPEHSPRWDGIDPGAASGTYGDYLTDKVARVFPELGQSHLNHDSLSQPR